MGRGSSKVGGGGGGMQKATEKYEDVNQLVFGKARITNTFVDIDGYSNKATEKAMLNELAKAVDKYDASEANGIRDMIKFNEIVQIPGSLNSGYIIEWERLPGNTAGVFDANDNYISKPAKWYVHVRFFK